jgi:hypothetical protein
MPITINSSPLVEMLLKFQEVTGRGIPEITRAHARLCAVELANRTQPFSVGKGGGPRAKKQGETRVGNDIGKIIKTKDRLDEIFNQTQSEKLKKNLQRLASAGRWEALADVFKKVGFPSVKFVLDSATIKKAHQANRSKSTGRTFKKADALYIATRSLPAYIREVTKRVGLSKSGWAECAKQIGGVKGDAARGIPAFAKRHSAGFGKVSENIAGANTSFTMTNSIPWADKVCRDSEQRAALNIAKSKMLKSMAVAIRAAKTKGQNVKNAISEGVAAAEAA